MKYELEPISKIISSYTNDDFVSSYANQIRTLSRYPEERFEIQFLTRKLVTWYDDEIKEIEKDKFIHNRDSHMRAYMILKKLLKLVEKEVSYG